MSKLDNPDKAGTSNDKDCMRSLEDLFREIEKVPDYYGHTITSVHYRNGWGDMPLHIVSGWGDCEAIKTLVEAGADIDAPGETGFTPLHCATGQNRREAVLLLLSLGAKMVENQEGHTPAYLAELLDHDELCKILNGDG